MELVMVKASSAELRRHSRFASQIAPGRGAVDVLPVTILRSDCWGFTQDCLADTSTAGHKSNPLDHYLLTGSARDHLHLP